jgi:DNA-binding NarL/FixJ family response regulator
MASKRALKEKLPTPSWDGLEDFIPEGYKNRVQEYIDDANKNIHKLEEEDQTLVDKVKKRPQPARDQAAKNILILQCLAIGMTQDQVAENFKLTRSGIQARIGKMKKDYRCKTTIELVARAMRAGFIE